jgi:alpha-tubulin suppressor-like RCC1 family protein
MTRTSRLTALTLAAALAACGGSDSPTGTTPPPTSGGNPPPAAVATVSVSPSNANVNVGATTTLAATVKDASGTTLTGRTIAWSSSSEAIARVDASSGVVTGVGAGTATITAASEGKSGTATVVVASVGVPVASVSIGTALDTLEAWDVVQLQAAVKDGAGNVLAGRTVRWASSNPAVATIDSVSGQLTGIDRGTVTVTATSEGRSGTASRVVVIRYRQITAGSMHACDIASGGIVWCWGLNGREGRIGSATMGDSAWSTAPAKLAGSGPTGVRFAQLSSYGNHTCGLSTEGKAYCWGANGWGQLGSYSNGNPSYSMVAVPGGLTFKQVSVAAEHSCALTTGGAMYCWGNNSWKQFATTSVPSSFTPVAVAPDKSFSAIATGSGHSCGVTTTGTGWCWGGDGSGQLGDGARISYGNTFSVTPVQVTGGQSWATIDAGAQFTCAVNTAGKAYCWGSNSGGRLGAGNTTETSTPVAVSGGLTFAAISAGNGHACGVTTQNDIYCWGANRNGQLGVSAYNGSTVPVRVSGAIKGSEVSASGVATGYGSHSCAISQDRLTAWCWGRNETGQLGNGLTTTGVTENPTPSIVQTQKPQ